MRLYRYLQTYIGNELRETDALAQVYNLIVKTSALKSWDPLAVFTAQALYSLTQTGGTLSTFMATWAPQNEASILAAGQETGLGPALLDKLIHHSERLTIVNSAVRQAFASLAAGLGLSFLALYWIGTEIFPGIIRSIKTDTFYGYAGQLKAMSDYMVEYGLVTGLGLLLFILLIVYSLPNLVGRARSVLDRLPPWSIYRDLNAATFLVGLATLVQNGVNEQQALVTLNRHAQPYLRDKISHLIKLNDRALPDRLASFSPPWPNLVTVLDLSVFMTAKRPDEGIEICSEKLLQDLEERMKRITSLVSLSTMGFIALLSFWMYAAVNDISKSVQTTGPTAMEVIVDQTNSRV
ncbi:hypothetical protein CYMTET_5827 [Cymbomonas tetramitiformis]|uniref:Uncharacterized protein n=1 Tax=Cymbomonas tetramitiformis TaxID=36881 RepID=A0AAE0GYU4_9CHLO|nr:hypothetical protein CYMTET_5827 [Cymbomonas tetramitiformis]